MKTILLILLGTLIGYVVAYITFYLMNRYSKWHIVDIPKFCFHCHKIYIDGKTKAYVYCPLCGKELREVGKNSDQTAKKD